MGGAELKAALLREAESRARNLWQMSEEIVEKRRKKVENEILKIEDDAKQRLREIATMEHNAILFEAQQKASGSRLQAEVALCERFKKEALEMLPDLTKLGRTVLWNALLAELPDLEWTSVSVCPEDAAIAKRTFPRANVTINPNLGGGMMVSITDNQINVDNSLACRLNRFWPDLLPKLIAELYRRLGSHATVGTETPNRTTT